MIHCSWERTGKLEKSALRARLAFSFSASKREESLTLFLEREEGRILLQPSSPFTLTNQHAVSVAIETVARFDGMLIRRKDPLTAGESAHQRKECGTRQMKVCEQTIHDTKSKSRNNE